MRGSEERKMRSKNSFSSSHHHLFSSKTGNNNKVIKRLLLLSFVFLTLPASAFKAANPYWINLKPKLLDYLRTSIDRSQYTYKVVGPNRDLENFLGNRQNATIRFSHLNLTAPSHRKTVIASAYNEKGQLVENLPITVDVWVYHEVYMLKKSIAKGDSVEADNFYKKRIAIRAMDKKMFFDDNVHQKVANINIAANTALKKSMLRHQRLVQIGDMIKVISGSKFINLEFMCKAMSSGDKGDIININCADMRPSNKKAEITETGLARLI